MDPYQGFFDSLNETFSAPQHIIYFLIMLLLMGLFFVIIYYIYRAYQNSLQKKKLLDQTEPMFKIPPKHITGFNPAQRRILNSLIADFKTRELIAAAIPSSVLERYSEYFYHHLGELQVSNQVAQTMAKKIFPITEKSKIEIEILENNKLYVLERPALAANNRAVVIDNLEGLPFPVQKGIPVNVCYTANNAFICGESSIVNLLPDKRIVLSYPKNLKISDERHYSRIPVENLTGTLVPDHVQNASVIHISIKDISFEGVRVQTPSILKKKASYSLSFIDMTLDKTYDFDKIECVISKSFMIGNGISEYGLSFVYLDQNKRARLNEYFQALAARFQKELKS